MSRFIGSVKDYFLRVTPYAAGIILFVGLLSCATAGKQGSGVLTPVAYYETDEQAVELATKFDGLLVQVGTVLYAVDSSCLPERFTGGDTESRKLGGDTEGRKLGGDTEGRKLGGDTEGRKLGGDTEDRKLGGDTEDRKLGGGTEDRKLGGDTEGRKLGGDTEGRKLGGDTESRNFGGANYKVRCFASKDGSGFTIDGLAKGAQVWVFQGKVKSLVKKNFVVLL